MISCTEFISSYSALFEFLEKNYGEDEVHRYWDDIFDPERNGLLNQEVSKNGIRGCFNYWSHALNEEAADFEMYLNEADGWFMSRMNHCPSKGRLLGLKHVKPYHMYCMHCDLYRKTIEKYGLCYDFDFTGTDKAACSMTIYDPKVYKGRKIVTPDTIIVKRKASDNRYMHKDFHLYMNMGVEYLGSHYGTETVERYLREFTLSYMAPLIEKIKAEGLAALKENILATYKAEEAEENVSVELSGDSMTVRVSACPAVTHIKLQGNTVSKWYSLTTETVMATIAAATGYDFAMRSYDEETGRAEYSTSRK